MLVLSRKLGQSFAWGPTSRVTVVKIDRNSVRIGIEALAGEVPIQREGDRLQRATPRLPGASRRRAENAD